MNTTDRWLCGIYGAGVALNLMRLAMGIVLGDSRDVVAGIGFTAIFMFGLLSSYR